MGVEPTADIGKDKRGFKMLLGTIIPGGI